MRLPSQATVVVLGGGIAGLMCAFALHQAKIDVCIIERGKCGSGCSNAAGGILFPLKPWEYSAKLVETILQSNIDLPIISAKLQQLTGIDAECIKSGICFLDSNPLQQLEDCLKTLPLQTRILDKSELQALLLYSTNIPFQSAICIEDIYQLNPANLVQALRNYFQQQSILLCEHCNAESITVGHQGVTIKTSSGTIFSKQVVVSLGAWSQKFLQNSELKSLPVTPVKGQMLQYSPPVQPLQPMLVHNGYYLIPRRDGSVVAGSTLENAGFDNSTSADARALIHRHALEACPALQNSQIIRQWAGLRPATDANQPHVGAHSDHPQIWLNYGHHRYGFALSVSSAQTIVRGIRANLSA